MEIIKNTWGEIPKFSFNNMLEAQSGSWHRYFLNYKKWEMATATGMAI